MEEKLSWDWSTQLKEIPVKEWASRFNWVEDPCITQTVKPLVPSSIWMRWPLGFVKMENSGRGNMKKHGVLKPCLMDD